jgi:hypothetical protein
MKLHAPEVNMLTILKNSERGLVTLDEPIEGCWLRVVEPTQGELGQLEEWGFEQDLVRLQIFHSSQFPWASLSKTRSWQPSVVMTTMLSES